MEEPKQPFLKTLCKSVIRHGLTLAAGALIAKGALDTDFSKSPEFIGMTNQIGEIASGLVFYGISQFWSLFEKRKKRG